MALPVTLQTRRLVLRPFQSEDVEDALVYRNDPEFVRFLPHIPHPFTRRDALTFVNGNMSLEWNTSPTFAVTYERRIIGTVNLEVNRDRSDAMIGYAIGKAWWGVGLATEAAGAAKDWAVEVFALKRLWASTDIFNLRSCRVLEKLGLMRESIQTAHHKGRDGEPVDEVFYGLNLHRS